MNANQYKNISNPFIMPLNSEMRIAIAGYGKVGSVLAKAFLKSGFKITGIVERNPVDDPWLTTENLIVVRTIADLPSDIQFLVFAVAETQIGKLADEVIERGGFQPGTVVAHTAGSMSAEALDVVREVGALPLAWHPLQTFIGGEGPELLAGATFGIDGDPAAVKLGEELALELGGVALAVPPVYRPLYHLAAVIASNMMTGLTGMAIRLLSGAGFSQEEATSALGPLIERTAQNLSQRGMPDAVSGPLRRGDSKSVKEHLRILDEYPEAGMVYRKLSLEILDWLGNSEVSEKLKPLLEDLRDDA